MAPRLIRRRPLVERIKAYLNPFDFLLWLSEELDSNDWEQWEKELANPIGLLLNVVFLIARANSAYSTGNGGDDVFGDDMVYTPWLAWFVGLPLSAGQMTVVKVGLYQAAFLVHILSLLSFVNTAYTFYRQRHYRLFENSIDAPPSTPSAHRVRVDTSPIASSPLRFLSSILARENAEARSHPDATRDVWEVKVWDPIPFTLRMFCLFSPGHVLVYWLFLPTAISDPRPSTTIMTTVVLVGLLSAQMLLLQSSFSQQSKDASVIQKEVMNEYDTKYVHPRTQPQMRDVGTQYCNPRTTTHDRLRSEDENDSVDIYAPTFIVNRGFRTRPNPNYAKHVDPDGFARQVMPSGGISTNTAPSLQTPAHLRDASSPIRPQTAIRQPHLRAAGTGDGGSLGVFSHANSPLRTSAPTNFVGPQGPRERSSSPAKREGSPLKRSSFAPMSNGQRFGRSRI